MSSTWKQLCNTFEYDSTQLRGITGRPNRDIVVVIQSRDRPESLTFVLSELYSKSACPDSFDIFCLIDDDQLDLYKEVKAAYPEVIWYYPKHVPGSFTALRTVHNRIVLNNDYYFYWQMPDDVRDIHQDWDKIILEHKGKFKDDLFIIGSSPAEGRKKFIFDACYLPSRFECWSKNKTPRDFGAKSYKLQNSDSPYEIAKCIWHYCALMPVFTKEWMKLMVPIFNSCGHGERIDSIATFPAATLMILLRDYEIKRMIALSTPLIRRFDRNYKQHVWGGQSAQERWEDYKGWTIDKDFETAKILAKKMHERIQMS